MIKFSEIQHSAQLDCIELAYGCPVHCFHCGGDRVDLSLSQMTREMIDRVVALPLVQTHSASIITTGVNTEFLFVRNFLYLSEKIADATNYKSRMIFITHGVDVDSVVTIKSFSNIVAAACRRVIPAIAITVDNQRKFVVNSENGPARNIKSYAETLRACEPAIADGVSVMCSLQGTADPDHRAYIDKIRLLFEKALSLSRLPSSLSTKIYIDERCGYVAEGKAKLFTEQSDSALCSIIPNTEYVKKNIIPYSKEWRMHVDFRGKELLLKCRPNRPLQSYNDIIDVSGWTDVDIDN